MRQLRKEVRELKEQNEKLEEEIEKMPITGDVNVDSLLKKNRRLDKEVAEYKSSVNKLCQDLRNEFDINENLIRNNYENLRQLNDFSNVIMTIDDK